MAGLCAERIQRSIQAELASEPIRVMGYWMDMQKLFMHTTNKQLKNEITKHWHLKKDQNQCIRINHN